MQEWCDRGRNASLDTRVKVALSGCVDWARPYAATAPVSNVVVATCWAATRPVTVAGSMIEV